MHPPTIMHWMTTILTVLCLMKTGVECFHTNVQRRDGLAMGRIKESGKVDLIPDERANEYSRTLTEQLAGNENINLVTATKPHKNGKESRTEAYSATSLSTNKFQRARRFPRSISNCVSFGGNGCSRCQTGYYGDNCERPCKPNCEDGCHKDSGQCRLCQWGYYGPHCERSCPMHCRSDHNRTYCEKENGHCSSGCKHGFWGDKCKKHCSNCVNSECNIVNGTCVKGCKPGFYTANCEVPCPENCKDDACTPFGVCSKGCRSGYYGDDCRNKCNGKCKDNVCNQTGVCIKGCDSGFAGDQCSRPCFDHCVTCSQYNNTCESCIPGFSGPFCENDIKLHETLQNGSIMQGLILLILMIIGILLGIFLILRWRKRTRRRQSPTNHFVRSRCFQGCLNAV